MFKPQKKVISWFFIVCIFLTKICISCAGQFASATMLSSVFHKSPYPCTIRFFYYYALERDVTLAAATRHYNNSDWPLNEKWKMIFNILHTGGIHSKLWRQLLPTRPDRSSPRPSTGMWSEHRVRVWRRDVHFDREDFWLCAGLWCRWGWGGVSRIMRPEEWGYVQVDEWWWQWYEVGDIANLSSPFWSH